MKISKYLDQKLVLFLDVPTCEKVFEIMVDKLDANKKILDKTKFLEAIKEREKIVSTGIGMGVAIPHAKLPNYDNFFIEIAILRKGVEWHSLDGTPVRIVFMIGGPDDMQTEYLQILSIITQAIKSEDRRKKLLNSSTPEQIIAVFENI